MTLLQTQTRKLSTPAGQIHVQRWWRDDGHSGTAPIVLFHDSLGSVALWREFPAQLAQASGRTVLAYDRLGFGDSDPHPGPLPFDFIRREAEDTLAAVLEAFMIDSFYVLGHSVGGCMALCSAAHYPQRCLGVISESAQARVDEHTRNGLRAAQQAFAEPGQIERLARYHGDKAPWVLRAWLDTWLSEAFTDWSLDAELPRVRCPLLVLHGDQDEYGSVQHPQRIAALSAGPTQLCILDGCGHLPHREQPQRVLAEIRRWLPPVDGSAAGVRHEGSEAR